MEDDSAGFADHLGDFIWFLACLGIALAAVYVIVPLFNPAWSLL